MPHTFESTGDPRKPGSRPRRRPGRKVRTPSWGSHSRMVGSFQRWALPSSGACHSTIHRPPRPARLAGCPGRPRRQPAVVLAPGDAGRLPGRGRRPVGVHRARPGAAARRRRPGPARRARTRRRASSRCSGWRKADLDRYLSGERWYHRKAGADAPRAIAYFSPEYGITAVLPQYSGGLGILAGDHLKAASDLGVPLVGVGLMYRHGYFKQSLSREGWQQETYPVLDPDELPLSLLREPDGSRAIVTINLPGGAELLGPDLGGQRRPGAAAAARLRHRGEPRPPPRGHRPAVRRQQRAPPAPGAAARRRRRARAARATPASPARRSRRSSTPTRATPASSASSGSAS